MYKFVKGFKNNNNNGGNRNENTTVADTSITSSSRIDQGVSSGDDTAPTTTADTRSSVNVRNDREDDSMQASNSVDYRPLSSSSFSIDESTGETIASRQKRPNAQMTSIRTRSNEVRPTMSTLYSDLNTTTMTSFPTSSGEPKRSKSSHPSTDTSSSSRPSSIVKIKPSSK